MRPSSAPKLKDSGLTLPEVLISMGILGLVMAGVYTLIAFTIRWNAKMSDTVEVYQRAFQASNRLSYDLGTGAQSTFVYEVDGLAFASARPDSGPFQQDSAGQVLWQKYVFYYIDAKGDLYRNEEKITPPTTAPTPPVLATLKSGMASPGQLLAKKVSDLEITSGSGANVKFKVSGDRTKDPNFMTLETRVTFRQ